MIYKTKNMICQLLFLASLLLTAVDGHAALDNKGTEFILQWLNNYSGGGSYELHLSSDVTTDVTIQYPLNSPTFTQVVTVNPGSVEIVSLPIGVADGWVTDSPQNNAVHVYSDKEFVAYTVNRITYSSDAALGLPVDTFNTEYIVATWDQLTASEFGVYAAYDNTTVTITPSKAVTNHTAGVPYTITLNRGEGYLAKSTGSGNNGNLTGTIISSDRPVGMVNGNVCTNVPLGTYYCDHIYEIAQPVQSWGKSILISNLPNRSNTFYQAIASEDNTTVSQNGAPIGTINKGQFIQFSSGGDDLISGNKPIYVTQFMTGSNSPGSGGIGDPAMGNMIPFEQYLNKYTFSTVGGSQFVQNHLSLIAPNSQIGIVKLDGAIVATSEFSPIAASGYSVARLPLTDGVHSTSSTLGHGITVEGYNNDDSYIYPGGAQFEFINPAGDANPPICSLQNNAGTPPSAGGSVIDDRPSEDVNNNGVLDPGEDLNNNGQIDTDTGVFFVELAPGANNLTLTVNPFTPGDDSVTYGISLTNPSISGSGTLTGKDGAGNVCSQPVNLNVSQASCDANSDSQVNQADLAIIKAANRTANPAYDIDGDGVVSYNDLRKCVLQCTNAGCN